jgi:hypothetical protein
VSWDNFWIIEPLDYVEQANGPVKDRSYYAFYAKDDSNRTCPFCGGSWNACGVVFAWMDPPTYKIVRVKTPCKLISDPVFEYRGLNFAVAGRHLADAYTTAKKKETVPPKPVKGPHKCTCTKVQVVNHGCICNGL